jgi:hypothetical protein
MKKILSSFLKFVLPVAILLLGVGFIYVFEFHLKDRVNTVPVIVASKDIGFKEQLTSENIAIINVKRERLVTSAYYGVEPKHLETLYGRTAAIDIKQGTQIYEELIDSYNLIPDHKDGEFIAPIPNNWIYAVPGSLRRSFVADFYVVNEGKDIVVSQKIKGTLEEMNQDESVEVDLDAETTVGLKGNASIQSSDDDISKLGNPILSGVKIAYTKDSSNKEVRDAKDEGNKLDGTGTISNIEIIANEESLTKIRSYVENGYKLYITYSYKGAE